MTQQSGKRRVGKKATVVPTFAVSERVRVAGQLGVVLGVRSKTQVSVKFDNGGYARVVSVVELERVSG